MDAILPDYPARPSPATGDMGARIYPPKRLPGNYIPYAATPLPTCTWRPACQCLCQCFCPPFYRGLPRRYHSQGRAPTSVCRLTQPVRRAPARGMRLTAARTHLQPHLPRASGAPTLPACLPFIVHLFWAWAYSSTMGTDERPVKTRTCLPLAVRYRGRRCNGRLVCRQAPR